MLKNISKIGSELTKKQQRNITGGKKQCDIHAQCGPGNCCNTAGWCQVFGANTGYLCDGSLIDI